ncbi:beta-hexosaminidase [Burkholderia stabilis]|uniref:beta-hexosaminidase n=1 Tax=Burkholderia cepacia complex TaxID=87882 RepID=UPI000851F76F|nr:MULTISPECIES: beta-hexosaminidase [Burkholderia cepacia complex]AOR69073.1 beta-hexosaminidase [Burkholderia stabilis]MBR8012197.1 beta-hexosaminidase [Burkholderia vietnamiensis]MDN7441655.1 beta-hexosaminidase [Burkholderia cepacia]HDR9041317.1 beta-hexosaminidase [Burkholderia vietnamiensis]HDR9198622.1 beta-hexosaminidase [Burkholderia vietnamiensis]
MPRIKSPTFPLVDIERRDTLSIRTITRYDRNARRPSTPILVGKYIVGRRPMADSVHTEYLILDGTEIAHKQISIPSEGDCADAIKRLRDAKRAAGIAASNAIDKAKNAGKPRATAAPEVA